MISEHVTLTDAVGRTIVHRWVQHYYPNTITGIAVTDGPSFVRLHRMQPRLYGAPRPSSPPSRMATSSLSRDEVDGLRSFFSTVNLQRDHGAAPGRPLTVGLTQPPQPYLSRLVSEIAEKANRSTWRHERLKIEAMQLLDYVAGDGKDWHRDGQIDVALHWLGVIIMISAPDSYEGGEIQIGRDGTPVKMAAGQYLVVPGDLWHRVLPVTAGSRRTITAFLSAPPAT